MVAVCGVALWLLQGLVEMVEEVVGAQGEGLSFEQARARMENALRLNPHQDTRRTKIALESFVDMVEPFSVADGGGEK